MYVTLRPAKKTHSVQNHIKSEWLGPLYDVVFQGFKYLLCDKAN